MTSSWKFCQEILSWLPVKSLLESRFVCKSWNSLISDPNFVKLHLHRSARNPILLLLRKRVLDDMSLLRFSVRYFNIDEDDDCYPLTIDISPEFQFVGSCNGLICLRCYRIKQHYFYLWNPATKLRSKYLTGLHDDVHDDDANFYPRCGFGYDNLSGTYKVVAFCCDDDQAKKVQVKICSYGDNRWRNIDSFPVVPFDSYFPWRNDGLYFNDTLNWLASHNNNYIWGGTITIAQSIIVSLDLGTETCTQFLLPHLDEATVAEPIIRVWMDCLCFSHHCKQTHFVVRQMKEFGVEKSWTQFMKVSYQDLQIDWLKLPLLPHFFFINPLLPLAMSENGDVLIMVSNLCKSQATVYHRRDNRVERIELPNLLLWNNTMDYVESLVSPCCN